jgi:hypothetical protein
MKATLWPGPPAAHRPAGRNPGHLQDDASPAGMMAPRSYGGAAASWRTSRTSPSAAASSGSSTRVSSSRNVPSISGTVMTVARADHEGASRCPFTGVRLSDTLREVRPRPDLEVLPDGSELVVLHESGGMHARQRKEAPASRPGRLPDTVARLVTCTVTAATASGKRKTTSRGGWPADDRASTSRTSLSAAAAPRPLLVSPGTAGQRTRRGRSPRTTRSGNPGCASGGRAG